jgi:hypothetical protein
MGVPRHENFKKIPHSMLRCLKIFPCGFSQKRFKPLHIKENSITFHFLTEKISMAQTIV